MKTTMRKAPENSEHLDTEQARAKLGLSKTMFFRLRKGGVIPPCLSENDIEDVKRKLDEHSEKLPDGWVTAKEMLSLVKEQVPEAARADIKNITMSEHWEVQVVKNPAPGRQNELCILKLSDLPLIVENIRARKQANLVEITPDSHYPVSSIPSMMGIKRPTLMRHILHVGAGASDFELLQIVAKRKIPCEYRETNAQNWVKGCAILKMIEMHAPLAAIPKDERVSLPDAALMLGLPNNTLRTLLWMDLNAQFPSEAERVSTTQFVSSFLGNKLIATRGFGAEWHFIKNELLSAREAIKKELCVGDWIFSTSGKERRITGEEATKMLGGKPRELRSSFFRQASSATNGAPLESLNRFTFTFKGKELTAVRFGTYWYFNSADFDAGTFDSAAKEKPKETAQTLEKKKSEPKERTPKRTKPLPKSPIAAPQKKVRHLSDEPLPLKSQKQPKKKEEKFDPRKWIAEHRDENGTVLLPKDPVQKRMVVKAMFNKAVANYYADIEPLSDRGVDGVLEDDFY